MADTDAIMLVPVPLTGERFAPYGDVIEALPGTSSGMNDARFERFDNLCNCLLYTSDAADE